MIDLVVVNLYPFQQTIHKPGVSIEDAIENIDIGGVALIRAAAKNYQRVTVVTDPADYSGLVDEIKAKGEISLTTRQQTGCQSLPAHRRIRHRHRRLSLQCPFKKQRWKKRQPGYRSIHRQNCVMVKIRTRQRACYHLDPQTGPLGGEVLQGKALSYNNLLDLDAAWRAALSFTGRLPSRLSSTSRPAGSPSAETLARAFELALQSDPVSAFGGVIAANQTFDADTVDAMGSLFVECIIAPGFTPEALEKLAKRKNCRLVSVPDARLLPRL